MRIRPLILLLAATLALAACGPAPQPAPSGRPASPVAGRASTSATGDSAAVHASASTSAAAGAPGADTWKVVPLPSSGVAGQALATVGRLRLDAAPGGATLLFSGATALCCLVAGTRATPTGSVHMLGNATCGHLCSLIAAGTGIFAADQISGSSCGEIFYRSAGTWQAVQALGTLCAPPPSGLAAPPGVAWKGWTEGVMTAGRQGLWVCLQHDGSTWDLGHITAAGVLATARLPGACEGMVSAPQGVLLAIRPAGVVPAQTTAAGEVRLGAEARLPGSPWTGTFSGLPGTLAAGPHGSLWYLSASASGSTRLYRWQATTGAVRSWNASRPCSGDYALAAAAGGVWMGVPRLPGSQCAGSLSFFSPAGDGQWTAAPAAFGATIPRPAQVGPRGGLWVSTATGVTAVQPDGAAQAASQGWPAGYTAVSVLADDGLWVAARSGAAGAYRWALLERVAA